MDLAKARQDLVLLLRAARQERNDATAALDALEDGEIDHGRIVIGGGRNEEMKQGLGAVRRELENAIGSIGSALANMEHLENVARQYDDAGIAHPVKAPKPAPRTP